VTRERALLLNVDDDETMRYVKSRILRGAGFDVVEAPDGASGMRLLHEHNPDLVLLDVKLPDANGRELAKRIKADPHLAKVVVLQTSASHVDSRHRVASLEAGADGYLVEPMEPEELVAIVRALLRMRRAEHELQQAHDRLQEADRRKDEFLAMLAHELRNPLAPIRNGVEILKSPDEAIRERARQLIGRQVEHMSRLVDDLLEVSRITTGRLLLRREFVTASEVVKVAVETVRPLLEEFRHELTLTLAAEPIVLHADVARLEQVFTNLLTNAIKYTDPGGHVRVTEQLDGDQYVLRVRDNGVGISPALLPHVFDLFTQGERSLDRSQGGLGIGLALVQRLTQLHGGSVEVTSVVGQGSEFVVRLPAVRAATPPPPPVAVAPRPVVRPLRILVVDDSVDTAESFAMLLQASGHTVRTAFDGLAAIDEALDFHPDVVLLDIGLGGLNGYEVAARLRHAPSLQGVVLVAVTGYGQETDRQKSLQAGFDEHLVKPADFGRLEQILLRAAAK
jgi:signal transduction histidine kinase